MNVTREVIRDLWPLFEAGEASPDTRALVKEFLDNDPEFARQLRAQAAEPLPPAAKRRRLSKPATFCLETSGSG
jgi:hypothetical protein